MDNEQMLDRLNEAFRSRCEEVYDQTWEEFRKAGVWADISAFNRIARDRWFSFWSSTLGVDGNSLVEWGPNAFHRDGEVHEGYFVIKNPGKGPVWFTISHDTALKILVMGFPETNGSTK